MGKTQLLILPHQLFEKKYLPSATTHEIILWEHPQYFKKYRYNQKRIVMHRGSMQYYQAYLKKKKYRVTYYTFQQKPKLKKYQIFDPVDRIKLPGKPELLENPNFLLTEEQYEKYRQKSKSFIFYHFYMWGKKELDIIPKVKSQDAQNRKAMPNQVKIPKTPSNTRDQKYIQLGIKYAQQHFSRNYGDTEDFMFPLSHRTAKSWLKKFLKERFKNFGQYQDAIRTDNHFLFHSLLSTSINLGLLQPQEVIEEALKYKNIVPLNSLEGFIRQIFWREYQRYCYRYARFTKNYFGNRKKLTRAWYEGKTGIDPVDDSIRRAFRDGYLHHIERLMIIGNFMNLSGISPKEGFRWFMEFSCDSYEWVMHQNVYDMVFFANENQTMRRPYLSSSNYILKMSNYSKEEWCEEWDDLYYAFLKKHQKKLWKYRYYFGGLKKLSR